MLTNGESPSANEYRGQVMTKRKAPGAKRETLSRKRKPKDGPAATPAAGNGAAGETAAAGPPDPQGPPQLNQLTPPGRTDRAGPTGKGPAVGPTAAAGQVEQLGSSAEGDLAGERHHLGSPKRPTSSSGAGRPAEANGSNGQRAGPASPAAAQSKRLMTLDRVPREKPSHLWAPWLPDNELVMLTGPTEIGKTAFEHAVMVMVTGGPHIDGAKRLVPQNVLAYAGEDSHGSRLRPGVEDAGGCLPGVVLGDKDEHGKRMPLLQLPDDIPLLRQRVEEYSISVLFISPIMSYLQKGISWKDNADVRRVVDPLMDLAHDLHCLIVCTHHPRKGTTGTALEKIGGGGAWGDAPRMVIQFGKDPQRPDRLIMTLTKNQVTGVKVSRSYTVPLQGGVPVFRLGKTSNLGPEDLTGAGASKEDRNELLDCIEFFKDALESGPKANKDLVAKAVAEGFGKWPIRCAKERLGLKFFRDPDVAVTVWILQKPADGWPE
jgi:hypothetical protein